MSDQDKITSAKLDVNRTKNLLYSIINCSTRKMRAARQDDHKKALNHARSLGIKI